jgi:hypothetical protein
MQSQKIQPDFNMLKNTGTAGPPGPEKQTYIQTKNRITVLPDNNPQYGNTVFSYVYVYTGPDSPVVPFIL